MKNFKYLIITTFILFSNVMTSNCITPEELMNIDYSKKYKSYSVSELRLIRSMVYAKHGFLLMESELRNYFMKNFNWYDTLIYKNAELQFNDKPVPPIIISKEEKEFVAKIDDLIKEKCEENYHFKDTVEQPNVQNICNDYDFEKLSQNSIEKLTKYGFVIKKDSLEQLFHLYDGNFYTNTPNFITTDLFLQLFHAYFSYELKELERASLAPQLELLTKNLYENSLAYTSSNDKKIKEMAEFNACFFAIANTLITGYKIKVPLSIAGPYLNELKKIEALSDENSTYFHGFIPYSLFTPRGYYTRTEPQKRYFKAMMWLQIAPYCLNDTVLLQNSIFNAFLLNNTYDKYSSPIMDRYNALYDPIAFLVGDADNLSIKDICKILDDTKLTKIEIIAQKSITDMIARKLKDLNEKKDKIQPKIKLSCFPKINFMPQRYLVDNDILQEFVDIKINAEKDFPKGLEVFASMGVDAAKDILYNYYHENKKWVKYDSVFTKQIIKAQNRDNWQYTVYNKWLEALVKLNNTNKDYPPFMYNNGWKLKNLNTSLASWAELKHDAILYGEQPSAAEMGYGGEMLPPPVTFGYVEPNMIFWNSCKELMNRNTEFLYKYNLYSEDLSGKTESVQKILNFMIAISQKELANLDITEEEFHRIENISGEFDYLTLNLLNPYVNYSDWIDVKGPDKTIAVIADVYTRNVPDCPRNGILHEATGLGNAIYVIVEYKGLLYLTKGAVFSYYEFPYNKRLTDEEWLEMVKQNRFSPVDWTEEITGK